MKFPEGKRGREAANNITIQFFIHVMAAANITVE
jgi:hypothetical protein